MDHLNIGFIGLGNMGGGICLNIIRAGYKVIVHDINKEAALPALEMGATWEDNPKELFIDTYSHTILTPHEGEFRRLFGEKIASIEDKVVRTVEASKIAGSIIVLKGSDTVIADPEGNVVINSSEAPYFCLLYTSPSPRD